MTPRSAITAAFFAIVSGCAGTAPPPDAPETPPEQTTTSRSAGTGGTGNRADKGPARTPEEVAQGFQAVLASLDLDGRPVGQAPDKQVTALVVFASWCGPCRVELALLGELVREEPRLRVIGINYLAYEEYADRSDDSTLRRFLADSAPWLQVVRADDALMNALGRPKKVPSLLLFDTRGARGRLVRAYLRARRRPPTKDELHASILGVLSPPGPGSDGAASSEPDGAR